MSFCLLPDKVAEFKQALKDKDISLGDLVNMESADRIKLLEPYAGENAKAISTAIEEKLILKNKIQGLKNLMSKLTESGKYDPKNLANAQKALSDFRAKQQERVFNPTEEQNFYQNLAEKITGVEISREVAQKVFEMQTEIEKLKNQGAKMSGVSDEYLQKNNELNAYISSFKPLGVGESIAKNLAIWGRNALISNPSTPIKAMENQAVNSAFEAIARRTAAVSFSGENADLASKANKEAWDTFLKTGMNTAGMESMDDSHMLGKGENFRLPQGTPETKGGQVTRLIEKGVRKAAEVSNKVVIDWAHNVPFTKFYQKTFFDAANFSATDFAKKSKMSSADIFKDAIRIEPQTPEGKLVRMEAQRQAARITSTNETITSAFSSWSKNTLNKLGLKFLGGFPLGDFILPIAKIPASAIANKMYNAGFGAPFAIKDLFEGYDKLEKENMRFEGMAQIKKGWQGVSRIIGATALGIFLASQIKKEDYREDNYGNSFVRIGDTWINTEYASFLSPAFGGAVNARFKGTDLKSKFAQYISGVVQPLKALPGFDEAADLRDAITTGKEWKYLSDLFSSRGIPAFLGNSLRDRPINRELFGAHGVESSDQVKEDIIAAKKNRKQKK